MSTVVVREGAWQDPARSTESRPMTITSQEILRGSKKITIDHEGTEYTLHLTRQNKLLLTK